MSSDESHKRPHEEDDKADVIKNVKVDGEAQPVPVQVPVDNHVPVDNQDTLPDWFTPSLRAKVQALYDKGQVRPGDLDKNVLESMRDFTSDVQTEIFDKYLEADLQGIRNKTAFLVGILKRYRGRPENMAGPGRQMNAQQPLPGSQHSNAPSMAFLQAAGPRRSELAASTKAALQRLYDTGKAAEADFSSNVWDQLKSVSEEVANESVQKLAEADLSGIRNKSGFFLRIIQRIQEQHLPQDAQANLTAFNQLPFSVQMRLMPLYQTGILAQSDLEAKVVQSLAQFQEATALDIVTKFCESDLTKVTNKSGWLVGIIKRFRASGATSNPNQTHNQAAGMGVMGGMGAMGMGAMGGMGMGAMGMGMGGMSMGMGAMGMGAMGMGAMGAAGGFPPSVYPGPAPPGTTMPGAMAGMGSMPGYPPAAAAPAPGAAGVMGAYGAAAPAMPGYGAAQGAYGTYGYY